MDKETIQQGKELVDSVKELAPSEQVVDKISELAIALTDQLTALAPQALDVILMIKRVDSASELIIASAIFVLSLVVGRYSSSKFKIYSSDDDFDEGLLVLSGFCCIISLVLFAESSLALLSVWTWVGVFAPEFAIAKDIYDSVIN